MMRNRYVLSPLFALSLLLMLAACGQAPEAKETTAQAAENVISPAQTPLASLPAEAGGAEGEGSHYPVEIITYNFEGEEVLTIYEKAPERVLAVYQGCIETMIALGLEDRVVASYGIDNEVKDEWKEGFSRMHYDESSFAPDRETVVMMQPDLIFSWGSLLGENRLGDVDYWHANGTNTYINTNTRRGGDRLLENEYIDLLNIGKIFDIEEKTEALVQQMREDIAIAKAAVDAMPDKPLVAVITVRESDIRNYGMELAGDILATIGIDVIWSETTAMGKEDFLASNPDVIFLSYMPRPDLGGEAIRLEILATILDDPTYANIDAVLNGEVHTIMLGEHYAPAVRTADGIRTLINGLFPGLLE